ncbi:50S ribosome-binding GTPase [Candidatus Woesearchaeota archaeon]|nr:50S ribosome-binding GTPase [Candidatus Woesearchaeota archaeon]
MNFQGLQKIQPANTLLDVAFRGAMESTSAQAGKNLRGKHLETATGRAKHLAIHKIETFERSLVKQLTTILISFPTLDELPEFYGALVKTLLPYPELKQSLGALNWAKGKLINFHMIYKEKIRRSAEPNTVHRMVKEYFGRQSSVIKQIKSNLLLLEDARKAMKGFPNVKTGIPTIALFGFPNVGKTTLLKNMTQSKAAIGSYAFTTRELNVNYFKTPYGEVQLIDCPGTLNRFEKMNTIERVAWLALQHLADRVVYVLDLTEPFPLDQQLLLLDRVRKIRADKVLVYISKIDLLDPKVYAAAQKKYDALLSKEELAQTLLSVTRNATLDERNKGRESKIKKEENRE